MIEFSNLNKTFVSRAGKVEALKDVSLTVENGDIYGVIGFSGAGKSTLIRMANLLERPDSGSIKVDGVELTGQTEAQLIPVRRKIGMVFQQFNLLESRTVAQNIEIPMKLAGIASEQRAARVKELLQFVELSDKANTYVSRLSGGQKQRVGIARALALSPSILLCDEATSALDPQTTESILALLKKINRELGVTILLITHQMQVVQRICNKVAVMENGRIGEQGTVLDVFGSPKQEITRSFVRAIIQDEVPQSIQKIVKADGKGGKIEKGGMFKRYVDLLLPQKKLFAYAILSSLIVTILGIASSMFNKILMDEVLPYGLDNLLVTLILVFSMVSITNTLVGFVRQWVLIHLSIKIDIPLMLGYFGHIFRLPMKFFATRKTGDITTRYSDANTIKSIFTSIALSLIMDISMAIITGIILFRMNAMLFSISLFMALVSILLVLIYKQPYKKINEETMVQSAALNSQMIESLRGIETVKCNANEDTEMENLEREYIKSLKISLRSSKISTTQGLISSFISTGFSMLTTYVGISQVLKGEMTLGGFMAFSTLSSYFTSPLSNLIGLQMQIQEASISMKRLGEIMDYPSETVGDEDRTDLDKVEGDIEFKDVTFRYGNRAPALDHISFTIPAGKKVALVGSSGSGKSTITKLLLKYYEPEDGEIDLNGVNLAEYTNDSVRRAISYVPQNVELFSKTIYDNIRVSRMDATMDEVKEAAKKADAHDFIRHLPLQYNTYLEEAGNGLSGGEKQRIALARAFLKDSNLYILDESTSNLDFATENLIFNMIYDQLADRSMLIVAHRLSTVRDCDLILVMDHGKIVERGTHDELLAKEGKYYELWNMQQGIYRSKKAEPKQSVMQAVVEEDDDGESITY